MKNKTSKKKLTRKNKTKTVSTKRYWFRTKTFGWGWTPATWEGWVVTAFFLLMLFPAVQSIAEIDRNSHSVSDTLYAAFFYITFSIVDLIILIMICYKTGEKPRWRWGK